MCSTRRRRWRQGGERRAAIPALLLACAALCTTTELAGVRAQRRAAEAPKRAEAPRAGSEQLRAALERAYQRSDVVRPGREALRVQVRQGTVLLSGRVSDLLAAERAVEIAERTRGVRNVINRLEVAVPSVPDAELQRRVVTALSNDPATEGYGVQARVQDQAVVLTGDVSSWQERELSADVVKAVEGVRAVENRIGVEYAARRTDAQIKSDILASLRMNAWLDAERIDVVVDDGRVRLSGTVGTPRERTLAREDAWVLGVRSVSAQDLEVSPASREARPAQPAPSDAEIARGVRRALRAEPRVEAGAADVEVEDGVVTLTGVVDNVRARRAAVEAVRGTTGVADVVDYLQVRSEGPRLAENEATETVRRAIRYNPYVDLDEIDVTVRNGVAYLTGRAETWFARQQAEVAASTVRGVREVVNNIWVGSAESEVTDAEIERAVNAQLMWSPFVDGDRIEVVVRNGVATLTGTVTSQRAKLAAEENARDGGASDVVNLIRVRPAEGRAAAE